MRWLKAPIADFRRERRGQEVPVTAEALTLHALCLGRSQAEAAYLDVVRGMASQSSAHEATRDAGRVTIVIPGAVVNARAFGRALIAYSAAAPWARALYENCRALRRLSFQSPPDFVVRICGLGPHLADQCGRDWPPGMSYGVLGSTMSTRWISGPGCFFHPGDGLFPAAVMTMVALRGGMAVRISPPGRGL